MSNIIKKIDELRDCFSNEGNYSVDELATELNKCIEQYKEKVLGIHMFGIKYGACIRRNKYSVSDIIKKSGINDSYFAEINKGIKLSGYVYSKENYETSEYNNFKKLLAFFVKQLRINNDIEQGKGTSGKGADGDNIRKYYDEWRDYASFTLDCKIECGFNTHNSTANYIHYRRYNIRPHFIETKDGKFDIDYLYLAIYKHESTSEQAELNLKYPVNKYYIDDLSLFDDNEPNEELKRLYDNYEKMLNDYEIKNSKPVFASGGFNRIYYGTPGCGKSYKVKNEFCKKLEDGDDNYIRTIFHPDYTNSDFVGQIMPIKEEETIDYDFKSGPFTDALVKAYKHPNEKTYLIIEELNRGNAAAIFGELFQLLDRKDEGNRGESEYGIHNQYIEDYIKEKTNMIISEVKIPSNLSIIATMNTSDQNVYSIDTAFQRRWEMQKIRNRFLKDGIDPMTCDLTDVNNYVSERAYSLAQLFIPNTCVTWKEFVETINDRIAETMNNSIISDDKQVGIYFLNESELSKKENTNINDAAKAFSEKMLKYIWDDIVKVSNDLSDWFDPRYNTLDKVMDGFEANKLDIFANKKQFDKKEQNNN